MYSNQVNIGLNPEVGKRFLAFRDRNGMRSIDCITYLLDRVEREANNPRCEK